MRRIRTYGADGTLCRPLFLDHLLSLEQENKVILRRGRSGKVLAAHYCYEHPKPLRGWRNTNYIRRERVGGAHVIIEHKPLPWRAAEAEWHYCGTPEQVELALRIMFLQVVLSLPIIAEIPEI